MPLLSVKNFGCNSAVPKDDVKFTGLKTGRITHLKNIEQFSNRYLDGVYQSLKDKVAPDFIQSFGGDTLYKKANSLTDTLKYPFVKLPLEILDTISEKFHIKKLQNSTILTDFRKAGEDEKYERALRGLLQNGDNFFDGVIGEKGIGAGRNNGKSNRTGTFGDKDFKGVCDGVADRFYELFDANFAPDKAKYNTACERTLVRAVSGLCAAFMLGNDFYNKSIMNGKNDEEATKEAKNKRKQEIIATMQEAVSQYFMLGAFSEFVNNSAFGAPVLNTGLGILFHITSRLFTGTPLVKIKPENQKQKNTAKDKHILSLRNIIGAVCVSIGAGFALRGIKNTSCFKDIQNTIMNLAPVKKLGEKFHNATVGELWAEKSEIDDFLYVLDNCDYKNMGRYYKDKIRAALKNSSLKTKDDKIFIGEYEKFTKIPLIGAEVSNKELYAMPLLPFKIAKEIISYPYKLACSALEGLNIIKRQNAGFKNELNLVNTFNDFKKQAAKFGGDIEDEEFIAKYKEHIDENCLCALNKETKSNINNYNTGKLTALLGIAASIYFASTDDYNSTLRQTGDINKANKDARLRGINKMIRTSVQCVFLGLNDLFKIPYSKSLIGAGAVTAVCTTLTDGVSRILSGMPFRKMTKEELEQHGNGKKEGILKGYYEFLDKITN